MKVAVFGAKSYDSKYLSKENEHFGHELVFIEAHLNALTAPLAQGFGAVCVFVNDDIDADCLKALSEVGVGTVALRCAGFNNVDLEAAASLGINVVRVPEYSPHGVAEHAVALLLSLNRQTYRAYNRVRESNFSLEGLLGFNVNTKTVGVIGTGKIGAAFCSIMKGFGCRVIAYDMYPNEACLKQGIEYVDLDTLLKQSDIISLHCPLTPETEHLIDDETISVMKKGVMLINTSRGGLIDTAAVIRQLKSGQIGYLGLDVYEEEGDIFFEDISDKVLEDDVFARLLTFPNVLVTGHQAFFTSDALESIAKTTLQNLSDIDRDNSCANSVSADLIKH
ncbi:2-hydroxyacid dehydrogenase [Leucothrix arctica]|uniref:Hydroxyacid dehydrogenase n=1 Tax=Leucothrix arctica TaxID=1481894 RepID=A0A317CJC0_9GAMM|nr:2-hydroxyacid dehydrogenase [Leucothrix arctica]PWQ98281.1 hydroxyacid dehydrogenase [Leucothrix arctica]